MLYLYCLCDRPSVVIKVFVVTMRHLRLIVYTKLIFNISANFVTSMFSFTLNIVQQNCSIKIKIDRWILKHLTFKSGTLFLYFNKLYSIILPDYIVIYMSFVIIFITIF